MKNLSANALTSGTLKVRNEDTNHAVCRASAVLSPGCEHTIGHEQEKFQGKFFIVTCKVPKELMGNMFQQIKRLRRAPGKSPGCFWEVGGQVQDAGAQSVQRDMEERAVRG